MNTIKIFLAESGRIADLHKDFPLYQGQFNDKLLNVYVPTSILAPQFNIQHYIGQMTGAEAPSNTELNAFVVANTYPQRQKEDGDIIEFFNNSTDRFYIYTYSSSSWGSTEVDSFGTLTNLAGTSIKIGMTGLERNGSIYKSKSYFMRYLKTLTYQNVEYALYERKLPKEFTTLAGQGQNAPTIIANVVNIDTQTNQITSIITSQTCSLDVMTSTMLDNDETIEASELETLEAQVNENSAKILLKQNIIDNSLLTTNKTIVGAINEVKGTADENSTGVYNNAQAIGEIQGEQITQNENIEANASNIQTNSDNILDLQGRVSDLEAQVVTGETYIGQMTGSSLPTDQQLTEFVYTTVARQPQSGDVVIFVQTITGGTDKIYKYMFSVANNQWSGYELPAMEPASNDTKGIIQGNYNNTNSPSTQVNVISGEIEDIYVVDGSSTKRRLAEYMNTDHSTLSSTTAKANQNTLDISTNSGKISTLETNVANIINGTTAVGKATDATNDGLGNNIASTYLTNSAGVTKTQMRDYALPRIFNDVNFITADGYSDTIPQSILPIYRIITSAVGDFEIFDIEKTISNATFQLSNKNSYTNTIFVEANATCVVQFRLTTKIFVNNAWETANVELTDEINLTNGQIKKLLFNSTLNDLEAVYTLTDGNKIEQILEVSTQSSQETAFQVYSNDTYPSTFYLNTQATVIKTISGYIGEEQLLVATGTMVLGGVSYTLPADTELHDNTSVQLRFDFADVIDENAIITLSLNGEPISLQTPYTINGGNVLGKYLKQCYYETDNATYTRITCKGFVKIDSNNNISIKIEEDNLNSIKYGSNLNLSGTTLRLKDQDGNNLGNPVTIPETGVTEVEEDGNSVVTNGVAQLFSEVSIGTSQPTSHQKLWVDTDEPSLISALTGTSAPTTSTVAEFVGQFYIDTTNNHTYQCTAITSDGGTPEVFTYTWVKMIRESDISGLGGETWRKIYDRTLAEAESGIDIDQDLNNNAFQITAFRCTVYIPADAGNTNSGYLRFKGDAEANWGALYGSTNYGTTNQNCLNIYEARIFSGQPFYMEFTENMAQATASRTNIMRSLSNTINYYTYLTGIQLYRNGGTFPIGTRVVVYALDK